MLTITQSVSEQIAVLDRARTDGGLGSVCVDGVYLCRDVRGDPNYAEYQDFLSDAEMLREGMSCTDLQAMLAISHLGMVSAYEAWLAAPERTFEETQFALRAKTWERMHPFVLAVQSWMQMTDEQVDDFFELAVTL